MVQNYLIAGASMLIVVSFSGVRSFFV